MQKIYNLAFFALLAVYAAYGLLFIYRTSFEMDGERYFVLFDEAMISMRYGRNLARGLGLVWNPGERVEGFTHPLWVGYMALVHLLPLPASKTALAIQVTGLGLLLANLVFVRNIAHNLTGSKLAALLAVFLTAFYFSLNYWTLQGLEVGLVTGLLTSALWLVIRQLREKTFSPLPYVLLGIGTWVRLDVLAPALMILAYQLWIDRQHRRAHLQWGGGLLAGLVLTQTILRYAYYGELLPNAYGLKIAGYALFERVKLGVEVYGQFIWLMNWILFLLPFVAVAYRPNRFTALLLLFFLTQSAYSIFVGGGAWEPHGGANRFIVVAMPAFLVLMLVALEGVRRKLFEMVNPAWPRLKLAWIRWGSQAAMAGFVLLSLFSLNTIVTPDCVAEWTMDQRPLFRQGAEKNLLLGLAIRELTSEEARIAVAPAGIVSYFADRYAIDLLGKPDKLIARTPSGICADEEFHPGHNQWDYAHAIGELQPDIIVQLWSHPEEADPLLEAYVPIEIEGQTLYFREDSPNILWDRIP